MATDNRNGNFINGDEIETMLPAALEEINDEEMSTEEYYPEQENNNSSNKQDYSNDDEFSQTFSDAADEYTLNHNSKKKHKNKKKHKSKKSKKKKQLQEIVSLSDSEDSTKAIDVKIGFHDHQWKQLLSFSGLTFTIAVQQEVIKKNTPSGEVQFYGITKNGISKSIIQFVKSQDRTNTVTVSHPDHIRLYTKQGRKDLGPTLTPDNILTRKWQISFGKSSQTTIYVGFWCEEGFGDCVCKLFLLSGTSVQEDYRKKRGGLGASGGGKPMSAKDYFKKHDEATLINASAQMMDSNGLLDPKKLLMSTYHNQLQSVIKNNGFVGRGAVPKNLEFTADYLKNVENVKPYSSWSKSKRKNDEKKENDDDETEKVKLLQEKLKEQDEIIETFKKNQSGMMMNPMMMNPMMMNPMVMNSMMMNPMMMNPMMMNQMMMNPMMQQMRMNRMNSMRMNSNTATGGLNMCGMGNMNTMENMNAMGNVNTMENMNTMRNMNGMGNMNTMENMNAMRNMNGMGNMNTMENMNAMRNMNGMGNMNTMENMNAMRNMNGMGNMNTMENMNVQWEM
eukprot:72194_1